MDESEIIKTISAGYRDLTGKTASDIIPLPRSGSDRRYFRVFDGNQTTIGAYNANHEENEAYVGFTYHFRKKFLPVPEIYGYIPHNSVYFVQDLGDDNLYTWLHKRPAIAPFDNITIELYRKILDNLILFQIKGIEGLDLDLCYPHKSFDRQSMLWDLNYFKYMLLKLLAVPFNESRLEQDFTDLVDYLLEAGQEFFLYRDFQTANVMVVDESPWFIDYQGGRKGAPQYDVASLLYDAKIQMEETDRQSLLNYYIDNFSAETGTDRDRFRGHYSGFSMIRIMQALGAFGFRGLYEKKPTFTESIVPGVELLNKIIETAETNIRLPELFATIRAIPGTQVFKQLVEKMET